MPRCRRHCRSHAAAAARDSPAAAGAAAAAGEEALATLDKTRPDVITLDVVLPGIDGLATLAELKKKLPEVPVVMLSGHGQARNIVEAMKLMNELESEIAGTVREVLIEDGQPVQFGQGLFRIEPD